MLGLPEPGCAMHTPYSLRKLVGHYEVPQSLGGMGLVYRARDTLVRREVAVKTILDIPDPAKRIKKHSIARSGVSLAGRKFSFYIPDRNKAAPSSFGPYVELTRGTRRTGACWNWKILRLMDTEEKPCILSRAVISCGSAPL